MSDEVKRFLKWKRELNQKLMPIPYLSPIYDVGLVIKKLTKSKRELIKQKSELSFLAFPHDACYFVVSTTTR